MKFSSRYDILLISPKVNFQDFRPPLSLIYLASFLQHHGKRCRIIDGNRYNLSNDDILSNIRNTKSVGLSFYQTTMTETIALCRAIHERFPDLPVIGGGPLMTTSCDRLMESGQIDFGVIGEGEQTLLELLCNDFSHLNSIQGIVYMERGRPVSTQMRPHIKDLDTLPFLNYSFVDLPGYWEKQEEYHVPRSVFMTTSRGCAYKCSFCSTAILWPGKIRRYSVDRIIREINHICFIYQDVHISFMDDSFFADKKWLDDFFEKISPLNLTYGCIGRADHLSAAIVERLKQTGCTYVGIGVETGVPELQITLRKHLNLDRVKQSVTWLSRMGIFTKCYFMLGFPKETLEEMVQTINFAVELKILGMSDCVIFAVNLFVGTEMSRGFEEEVWQSRVYNGQEHDKLSLYSSVPDVSLNPYIPRNKLLSLIKLAYKKIASKSFITIQEVTELLEKKVTERMSEIT